MHSCVCDRFRDEMIYWESSIRAFFLLSEIIHYSIFLTNHFIFSHSVAANSFAPWLATFLGANKFYQIWSATSLDCFRVSLLFLCKKSMHSAIGSGGRMRFVDWPPILTAASQTTDIDVVRIDVLVFLRIGTFSICEICCTMYEQWLTITCSRIGKAMHVDLV